MLKFKIIGTGAAGNKAAINLIKNHAYNSNDIILMNSTSRDIEEEYLRNAIIFGAPTLGGCGKEREAGKRMLLADLKTSTINLDGLTDPDTNAIIIVSSVEGGSGSATAPILAKYCTEVLGLPVILVLFFGFGTDARGLQNSVETCKEIPDKASVIAISNASFLEEANGNRIKAEQLANEEFAKIVRTISGADLNASFQNIDDTDLLKLVTTAGYMRVEHTNISKIKNIDSFNKAISAASDASHLISSAKGCTRIGIMLDIDESLSDFCDYNAEVLSNYFGTPYEAFTHVQHTPNHGNVSWIVSGLPLPIKEVSEIYEKYLESSSNVNKNRDSFFDNLSTMTGNEIDHAFNMVNINKTAKQKSKSSFFADYGIGDKTTKPSSSSKEEY